MSTNQKIIEKFLRANAVKVIVFSFLLMCLGYYMLNYMARWEKPPLGDTFNIVMGCAFIAASFILILFTVYVKYFNKKDRRKKSRPVFLEDSKRKKH